jgi:hypothetical protein
MKKMILVFAVLFTAGLSAANAHIIKGGKAEDISEKITASFNRDFVSAQNVSWEQERNFSKATFNLNNQVLFAYYSSTGELLAVVRNILSDRLPLALLVDLKKNYKDYWISDLFEMATDNQTLYYMSLSNGNETLVLKSDDANQWSVYKTLKNTLL